MNIILGSTYNIFLTENYLLPRKDYSSDDIIDISSLIMFS